MEVLLGLFAGFMGLLVLVSFVPLMLGMFAMMLAGIAMWVLGAYAQFQIAKRRNVPYAWLSWIPYGSHWLMAEMSDRYRKTVGGKTFHMPTIMLIAVLVNLGLLVCCMPFIVLGSSLSTVFPAVSVVFIVIEIVIAALMLPASLAASVLFYIALYDVFHSCQPSNAVLYLVLSIVCYPLIYIFLFLVHKKDLGMPQEETVTA